MRLFAAVLPPPEAVRELAAEADRLARMPGTGRLRWTGRPGWHLTLAFYGEVADAAVADLTERLRRGAHRTAPFPLSLRGGGHFGRRALWAGAAGDTDALRLLAARAEAAGRKAGLALEEHRAYRPHLTLARSRDGADLTPCVTALEGFASPAWTVRELCLVRSHPPAAGTPGEQPRYETLAVLPLGAGDGGGPAAR
ncbi:RNA 2',3'-cyclic phosphodiesterase [Streptomyces sp. NPDC048566]|uniref:RNA 2',3'-cyclic phosphodiesterase n=1 Tax=Streptomyces sp. NPDC048566 TaxID=3365569 RepID=UPI00371A477E